MTVRGPFFVGVRGGGTSTRLGLFLTLTTRLSTLTRVLRRMLRRCAEEIAIRLTAMLSDMKRRSPQFFAAIKAFAFALAGIENTSEVPGQCVLKVLTENLHGRFVKVVNDGYATWYARHRGEPGITIVRGTEFTSVGVDNNSHIIEGWHGFTVG